MLHESTFLYTLLRKGRLALGRDKEQEVGRAISTQGGSIEN